MSKPESVCKTYAERIVKDLKLDGWFMKEQVKHIFSPEIKNISKTLAMMSRFGFVEIELVKKLPRRYVLNRYRVISLVQTRTVTPPKVSHYEKPEPFPREPCALAEVLGLVPIEHNVPRLTSKPVHGEGKGSAQRNGVNAWARSGE